MPSFQEENPSFDLRAMFTGAMSESSQTEVTIRDVDETAMDILIDFCYTSSIVVEENNVQTLLPAACLLQLAEIQVNRGGLFVQ